MLPRNRRLCKALVCSDIGRSAAVSEYVHPGFCAEGLGREARPLTCRRPVPKSAVGGVRWPCATPAHGQQTPNASEGGLGGSFGFGSG